MPARVPVVLLLLSGVLSAAPELPPGVVGRELVYRAGEVTCRGYIAADDRIEGKRPGVLVVHEWWGHNDYARRRAAMLAAMGYVALAVDIYGDGRTARHPKEAGAFAQAVRGGAGVARERFGAALEALKADPRCDPEKIAAIGYCFGGALVLDMARQGIDLDGVASFHGSLRTESPAIAGAVGARVLVCHGAADRFIPAEDVAAFEEEMEAAGVDFVLRAYEGATHSFTNPDADRLAEEFDLPIGYHEEADRASWEDLRKFLEGIFE